MNVPDDKGFLPPKKRAKASLAAPVKASPVNSESVLNGSPIIVAQSHARFRALEHVTGPYVRVYYEGHAARWREIDWGVAAGRHVLLVIDDQVEALLLAKTLAETARSVRMLDPDGRDYASFAELKAHAKQLDWLIEPGAIVEDDPPAAGIDLGPDPPPEGELAARPEDENALPLKYTELALAQSLTEQFSENLRYVANWGRWLIWDRQRWQQDEKMRVFELAKRVCQSAARYLLEDPELDLTPARRKTAASILSTSRTVAAVEKLSRSHPLHARAVADWDRDPWLLNTPGGTIDLRTGILREHRQDDHITHMTTVTPGGHCPLWLEFLETVTAGDHAIQGYLKRLAGYALTGITREHSLDFFYGGGGNGKGTFLNTLTAIWGDYAKIASVDTFVESRQDRHTTDLAMLQGARLVTAQETEEGRRWAEARIKALTGGDPITARYMRQDNFTFVPEFKLVIAGNHKPGVRSVDEALRRRLHLVPFNVTIDADKRDHNLSEKLKNEHPGILKWAIEGCLEWQNEGGLRAPNSVKTATEDYLGAEDTFQNWFDECCRAVSEDGFETLKDLYSSYKMWCEESGEYVQKKRKLQDRLEVMGFQHGTNKISSGYHGIWIKPK